MIRKVLDSTAQKLQEAREKHHAGDITDKRFNEIVEECFREEVLREYE